MNLLSGSAFHDTPEFVREKNQKLQINATFSHRCFTKTKSLVVLLA